MTSQQMLILESASQAAIAFSTQGAMTSEKTTHLLDEVTLQSSTIAKTDDYYHSPSELCLIKYYYAKKSWNLFTQ